MPAQQIEAMQELADQGRCKLPRPPPHATGLGWAETGERLDAGRTEGKATGCGRDRADADATVGAWGDEAAAAGGS